MPAAIRAERDVREPDLEPLLGMVGLNLRLAQIRLFEAFFTHFGEDGLRPGEICVLVAVGHNPRIRQGILAQALSIKRSNMVKVVAALQARGLVSRRVPAHDKRAIELVLTATGRAKIARALPDFAAHDVGFTSGALSAAERATLIDLLRRLWDTPDVSPAG